MQLLDDHPLLPASNLTYRRGRRLVRSGYATRQGEVRIARYRCRLIGTCRGGGIHRRMRGRSARRFKAGG